MYQTTIIRETKIFNSQFAVPQIYCTLNIYTNTKSNVMPNVCTRLPVQEKSNHAWNQKWQSEVTYHGDHKDTWDWLTILQCTCNVMCRRLLPAFRQSLKFQASSQLLVTVITMLTTPRLWKGVLHVYQAPGRGTSLSHRLKIHTWKN